MNKPFVSDRTFKGQDYTKTRLPKAEYENCIFEGCNFSDGYLDIMTGELGQWSPVGTTQDNQEAPN